MAHKGEDIDLYISGDEIIDLDSIDFSVLIYPDGCYDSAIQISRSEMRRLNANKYLAIIPYTTTKDMVIGSYTVEIVVEIDESKRSIFARRRALNIYDSASKLI